MGNCCQKPPRGGGGPCHGTRDVPEGLADGIFGGAFVPDHPGHASLEPLAGRRILASAAAPPRGSTGKSTEDGGRRLRTVRGCAATGPLA